MSTAPNGFIQETVTWTPVAQGLPDADTTVLLCLDETHNEPTWLGYFDGECWREISSEPIAGVTHWAHALRGARQDAVGVPPVSQASEQWHRVKGGAPGEQWGKLTPEEVEQLRQRATQQHPLGVLERCPTCGEAEPRTGSCGTSPSDTKALCNRPAAAGVASGSTVAREGSNLKRENDRG